MFAAVKNLQPYERRFFILMTISSITNSFPILTFLVTQYRPPFSCLPITNATTKQGTAIGGESPTSNYSVQMQVETCHILLQHLNFSSLEYEEKLPCESFQFELDSNENSALTEFNLVCEDEWVNDMAISLFMWGVTIGGLIGGILSDRFGRKMTFLVFTFVQFLFTFSVSLATDHVSYLILSFLNGISNLINYATAAVLGYETLPKSCHNSFYGGLGLMYAIGNMLVPAIAYFVRDWRWFCRVVGLTGILYIPYIWLLDESPSWLYASNKTEELEILMVKMKKYNGEDSTRSSSRMIRLLKEQDQPKNGNVWKTWKAIFKHGSLVGRLLVVVYSWSITSLIYHAITLNTNNLKMGNRFLNCFFSASTEVVGLIFCYVISEKVEQRLVFISSIGVAGMTVASTTYIAQVSGVGEIVMTMLAKFCASIAFYILYVFVPAIFPTTMRTSTVGLAISTSRLVGILTPLVMHGSSSRVISFVIGGLLILCALFNLSLPNTRNRKLPTTIEEALKLQPIRTMRSFDDGDEATTPAIPLQA